MNKKFTIQYPPPVAGRSTAHRFGPNEAATGADYYYLVAVISIAGTFKWQRLGDLVAETVVVREKKRDIVVRSLSLTQE
jgi:hypothetical protein